MPFRHDRRRRVLADDSSAAAPALDKLPVSENGVGKLAYSPKARRDQQPRITELLPIRYRTMSLWLVAGLVAVGVVAVADYWLPEIVSRLSAKSVDATLDTSIKRPLSVWFSTMVLGSAVVMSLLLYSLRRHRVDDYHGRYRVWLWAAALWFGLSLDETTSLHGLGAMLCATWSQRYGINPGVVWNSLCGVVLTVCFLRLAVEIRHSRIALTMFVLGSLGVLASIGLEADWAGQGSSVTISIATAVSRMMGHLLILFSLGAYTRHVTLEAEGLIASRFTKPKKKKEPKPKAEAVEATAKAKDKIAVEKPAKDKAVLAVDPPQSPKPHIAAKTDLETSRNSTVSAAAPARPVLTLGGNRTQVAAVDDNRSLSRAERKKVKREQRNSVRGDEDDE